ncbi:MAG: GntP family permease [Limnobacter sp.]|mgnify:FL=1|nr:GntP family permease [Limnobacter sp.]
MGLAGIILSLFLLMFLAYRGITVLVLAPILALFAVLLSGEAPLFASYTQIFMPALGRYLILYFPIFMLGAIFGKLMDDSGSARAIAHWIVTHTGKERAILAIVLACAILTYGGVSLFVVAFAVFPIAVALFREANVPKRLIAGAIALGSFTFTMTALPGTPAIQNAIPMPFFGTTPFAAPGLGLIAAAIMFTGGMLWLNRRARAAAARGENYADSDTTGSTRGDSSVADPDAIDGGAVGTRAASELPGIVVALVPIVLVIALNALLTYVVIPAMNTEYLAQDRYGATHIGTVRGIWALIGALVISIVVLILMNLKRLADVKSSINAGTMGSLLPIFNTASEVGYGATIASLPAFIVIRDAVLNISPGNPLVSLAVAVNVLAGVTGSASGGLSIALQTLGETYMQLAQQFGIDPEVMHRVASMSSGGFDALPHNGAVITLLAICGLTHRQSYLDIFMVTIVAPLLAIVTVVILGSMFGSF